MNKIQLIALMTRAVPHPPPSRVFDTGNAPGIEFEWFGHRFAVDPELKVTEVVAGVHHPDSPLPSLMARCFALSATAGRKRSAKK